MAASLTIAFHVPFKYLAVLARIAMTLEATRPSLFSHSRYFNACKFICCFLFNGHIVAKVISRRVFDFNFSKCLCKDSLYYCKLRVSLEVAAANVSTTFSLSLSVFILKNPINEINAISKCVG